MCLNRDGPEVTLAYTSAYDFKLAPRTFWNTEMSQNSRYQPLSVCWAARMSFGREDNTPGRADYVTTAINCLVVIWPQSHLKPLWIQP